MIHVFPTWLELLSLAFCTGALACRLWVFPPANGVEHASCEVTRTRLWDLFGIAVVIMFFFAVADLFVRTKEMSGMPFSSAFSMLPTVLLKTHYGAVWILRVLAEALLLVSWRTLGRCGVSRMSLALALVLTVIVSATESATGHAADKGDFSAPEIADFLHLAATSLWGGGLLVLSLFLLPELLRLDDEYAAPALAGVSRRFSRIAGIAVGITGITALYNGIVYVERIDALWKTDYGLIAAAKTILFLMLIGFGAFNRYINVPGLQGWAGLPRGGGYIMHFMNKFVPSDTQGGREIAVRFKRSVRFEAILIIGVLLCAALLRHEVPARHAMHIKHIQEDGTNHKMDGSHDSHDHMNHDSPGGRP